MSNKFQDAQMYSPDSPVFAHHSSDDDGDHAVFCFCGNEVEPDEEGDMGIYCSTACARKDALEALSSNNSQTSLASPYPAPLASSSYFNSTRPPVPSASCPNSFASNPLGQAVFTPSFSETNMPGLSPALSTVSSISSMASSEGKSSHYRRMEKERVALQRQRKKEREEAKQAAAHAAAMEILQTQRRIRQQRAEYHLRTASSSTTASSKPPSSYTFATTTNSNNFNHALSSGASLSRNNTASSTSSTQSRYISTHPSRAKTPDLVHHGRNGSLGSNTSSISSVASVAWGWNSRSGWGSQSREDGEEDIENPNLIREEDEELADDDLSEGYRQVQLDSVDVKQTGSQMKRSKASMSIVDTLEQPEFEQTGQGGLRMGALLDDILDMERGFTVGGSSSPRSNVSGQANAPARETSPCFPSNDSTSTPRTHLDYRHAERSSYATPPTKAEALETLNVAAQPVSASTETLRTPNQQVRTASKAVPPRLIGLSHGKLKRPFASTPPSSPHQAHHSESLASRDHHPVPSSLSSSSTTHSNLVQSKLFSNSLTGTPSGALSSRSHPQLPTAPIPRPRKSGLYTNQNAHHLGPAHRRSASTPFDISLSQSHGFTSSSSLSSHHAMSPRPGPNTNKKPKHRRSFSANEASSPAGWLEDTSSVTSPLPPLPVIYSRPRTLVYSPEDSVGDPSVVNLSWSPPQSSPEVGKSGSGWELPLNPPSLLGQAPDIGNSSSMDPMLASSTSSASTNEGLNLAPPLMLGSEQESDAFMDLDEGQHRSKLDVGNETKEGSSTWTRSGERLRAVLGWGDRD